MSSERRHRFRAPSDRRVHWRPDDASAHWQEGQLMDVSTGGARIRSTPAPIHHFLTVAIKIDAGTSLVLETELIRIESQLETGEFAWAVAFRNLEAADQTRLTRFVFTEAQRYTDRSAAAPAAAGGDGGAIRAV